MSSRTLLIILYVFINTGCYSSSIEENNKTDNPKKAEESSDNRNETNFQKTDKLHRLCTSILNHGILSPRDLEAKKIVYTPSSDIGGLSDKISFYDIDYNRSDSWDWQFGNVIYPGHDSMSPVIERRNDFSRIVETTLNYAMKGNELALSQFEKFRQEFPQMFPSIKKIMPTNLEEAIKIMDEQYYFSKPLSSHFMAMLISQQHVKSLLEKRAQNSILFISTGRKLENSSLAEKQAKTGASVQELRTNKFLEPEAISHVLLPKPMKECLPSLRDKYKTIDFILVEDYVEKQINYFNALSNVSTQVLLSVPNYQRAIEELVSQGYTRMLTHISNVD